VTRGSNIEGRRVRRCGGLSNGRFRHSRGYISAQIFLAQRPPTPISKMKYAILRQKRLTQRTWQYPTIIDWIVIKSHNMLTAFKKVEINKDFNCKSNQ
jgi:hypothetical protein